MTDGIPSFLDRVYSILFAYGRPMQAFYIETLQLPGMRRLSHAAFLSIAPDCGRHTQVLVLFDRSAAH